MSAKRTLVDWSADICSAIQNIRCDIGEMTETEFLYDGKTVRAVTKSMIDIGEAANHIMRYYPDVEARYPDVWQHLVKVYAMRIKLTHGYFGVDAGIVWSTSQLSLPAFERDMVILLSA